MKQGKFCKKVLSMLMAITMLFSVMTAVTVSAASEEWEVVGSVIDFETVDEGTAPSNIVYSGGDGSDILCVKDGGSIAAKVSGAAGTANNMFRATTYEYYSLTEGETYRISAKVKAIRQDSTSRGIQLQWNSKSTFQTIVGAAGRWSTWKYHLPTEWTPFTWEYTVPAGGSGSGRIMFMFDPDSNFTNEEEELAKNVVLIDDIKVEKLVTKPEVTVNVGIGGTVTYGAEAVSGRKKIAVENGTDVTLTVTPDSGNYATVKVDGAVVTPDANNQITLEDVSADSTVDVLFTENGWEKVVYIDFDGFGTTSDLGNNYATGKKTIEAVYDADMNSTVSKTTYTDGGATRVFNLPSVNWESGATYRLSYDAKATEDGNTITTAHTGINGGYSGMTNGTWAPGVKENNVYPVLSPDWRLVAYDEFTVPVFENGLSSAPSVIYLNASEYDQGELYFDNITIEKKIPVTNVDVTVNIVGNGGTVTNGETTVANGDVISVAKGSNLSLAVTPDNNYSVEVTKDGQELPVTEGTVSFVVNADSVVTVTFTEKAPVSAGIVKDVTYERFTMIDGVPTIYVYSQLNNFTTGEDNLTYGIKFWNQEDSEHKLTLNAYDHGTKQPALAQANTAFAIRIYGKAITADQVYKIKPFVGAAEGEELSVEFEG